MMRYPKYIILICSVLLPLQIIACGPEPHYSLDNYPLFRVVKIEHQSTSEQNPYAHENIAAWQDLCAKAPTYEDTYNVVYHYSNQQINNLLKQKKDQPDNSFLHWVFTNGREDYLQLLALAKQCEHIRWEMNDPWYFPSKNDPMRNALSSIEQQAQAQVAKHNELSDRYALQQMRALFTLQRWEDCLDLWNNYAKALSTENVMRKLMINYVYGAACHLGDNQKAQIIFNEQGSSWFASYLLEPYVYEGVTSMVSAYETYPDCPQLIDKLQTYLGKEHRWRTQDTTDCQAILALAERIIRERKVQDLAPWYYAASYLEDWLGHSANALLYSRRANQCQSTPLINESIHLWSIYIEYKNALPSDAVLLSDLQWLAKMQQRDARKQQENAGYLYDRWFVYAGHEMDFWHDAMRRIVHTVLVPKYLKQGNTTRALQLANYGANWFFRNDSICSHYWHSDDFFTLLYQQSGQTAERYVTHTLAANSPLDIHLAQGGNTTPDYLWDAVGTIYLRETCYAKAAKALEKVSPSFQETLRREIGSGSLFVDPFSTQYPRLVRRPDCKLAFAREMNELEKEMHTALNVNRRANAQIRYAIGMRHSFTTCRALTRYVRLHDHSLRQQRLDKLVYSDRLILSACELFDNDEDAAQAQLLLCNYSTAIKQYPNTQTAEYIRTHCDNYYDYHCEQFRTAISSPFSWIPEEYLMNEPS